MINRRGFFGKLFGLVAGAAVAPKVLAEPIVSPLPALRPVPPMFELTSLPLPVVHKDFSYELTREIMEKYSSGLERYTAMPGITIVPAHHVSKPPLS